MLIGGEGGAYVLYILIYYPTDYFLNWIWYRFDKKFVCQDILKEYAPSPIIILAASCMYQRKDQSFLDDMVEMKNRQTDVK